MSQAGSSADPSQHADPSPHVYASAHAYESPHRVDAVPREARLVQGQRAGIVTRTAANVIDFSMVVGALGFGYAAWCAFSFLINPTRFSFPAPPFLALLVCFALVLFAYFTVSWATTGRTYGNHLLALRVVNVRGERLRWPGAVVRAGFCVALPIGLFWAVLSPTNRSLQDTVLRTSVLYDWRRSRVARRVAESPPEGRITRPG
jgi:uncharacterized RDD family membrane protein YckC